MKAFCVNIPSETERRQHCERQYEEAQIDHEFIEAVDGRVQEIAAPSPTTPSEAQRWQDVDRAASKFSFLQDNMNSPARACALSHFKAWERAAQQSREDGLHHMVNEDDFKNADLSQLPALMEEVARAPFDIIYLGYRGGNSRSTGLRPWLQRSWHRLKYGMSSRSLEALTQRNFVLHRGARPARGFEHLLHAGMTWGGHAYLMNARGAEVLMEANRSLRFLPDEALRWVILEGKVQVGMSAVKHFVCEDFGSAIRSREEHEDHHQRYPST